MPTIYRKTIKGRTEIDTREHRLPPRLRSALIMVDGVRNDSDLAKLIASSDEVLDALAEQGFIEAVVSAPAAAPHAPPSSAAKPATPVIVTRTDDFVTRRRDAVRALSDAVGPSSEGLAVLIEKAKDEMTLRPLLVMARESIRNIRGQAPAAQFTAKFLS